MDITPTPIPIENFIGLMRQLGIGGYDRHKRHDKLVIEIPYNEQNKFEDMTDVSVTVNVKFLDTEGWIEGG